MADCHPWVWNVIWSDTNVPSTWISIAWHFCAMALLDRRKKDRLDCAFQHNDMFDQNAVIYEQSFKNRKSCWFYPPALEIRPRWMIAFRLRLWQRRLGGCGTAAWRMPNAKSAFSRKNISCFLQAQKRQHDAVYLFWRGRDALETSSSINLVLDQPRRAGRATISKHRPRSTSPRRPRQNFVLDQPRRAGRATNKQMLVVLPYLFNEQYDYFIKINAQYWINYNIFNYVVVIF